MNLPAAAAGQNIVLRWRMGSDTSTGADGWRIDSIVLSQPGACPAVHHTQATATATATADGDRNSYSARLPPRLRHVYANAYGHSNVHAYPNSNCAATATPTATPTATCQVTYTTATTTGTITAGGTDIGNHCDDCSTQINLPFPVSVYGNPPISVATVGSDGDIQFTATPSTKVF